MQRTALVLTWLCAAFVPALACVLPWASPWQPGVAIAAEITDATGRTVTIPDNPLHVLPAGPPAAVLLAAIAPGRMLGFPEPVGDAARAALAQSAAALPTVPRLTAQQGSTAAITALHPDLIIDYGTVTPRYQHLAEETQRRTGIPTLLFDGALDRIPEIARTIGKILHQPEQAEAVARTAEAILALPPPTGPHRRVLYARGADGLLVAAPNTDVTAIFPVLGWQVVAPEGSATFRPASIEAIGALDPDIIILADPAARAVLASAPWAALRAVREGHAMIAPSVPFGWVEEPPSINRLLGLAWLRGGDPLSLAALFNAAVYARPLTRDQLLAITAAPDPAQKP